MYRLLILAAMLAASALVAVPLTILFAVLITPALWRLLEGVLGIELAGRSGPSDWILWLVWLLCSAAVFSLLSWVMRRSRRAGYSSNDSATTTPSASPPVR